MSSAQVLKEISIGFVDGAEDKIYNELLEDSNKKSDFISLSWEKEKVNFQIAGKGEETDTKSKINLLPVSKQMEIELKPQSAIVIKTTKDKDNKLDKEITDLKSRIKELEKSRKYSQF